MEAVVNVVILPSLTSQTAIFGITDKFTIDKTDHSKIIFY